LGALIKRRLILDTNFLQSLGIIAISAALMVGLGRIIRMPAIVVYLLCGVVLGPVTGLVGMSDGLGLVSEMGIALLLFLVGLELSFAKVKDVGKVAIIAGTSQVVFTAGGGFGIALLLGFNVMESAFIGAGITFSSTVIAVKLLDEKNELDTNYGHIAVACSLVQSFLVILLLSVLSGLGDTEGSMVSMFAGIGRAFGGMLVMVLVVGLVSRYLLRKPFDWVSRSPDVLLIWSLAWCFAMILLANSLGLSLEIGSFLAGISLAQFPYNYDLHRRVHPLMNLFMAIFFVTLGVPITFESLGGGWMAPVLISVFVIVGNIFIYLLLIPKFGFGARTALLTGITGSQVSEFSFILVTMGVTKGMVNGGIVGLMTMIGFLTMGVSAYLIRYNHQIADFLTRIGFLRFFGRGKNSEIEMVSTAPSGHVIVVGMNTLGRDIVRRLADKGEDVLAIDTDPRKLRELPGSQLRGSVNYLSVLEEAGYARAKLIVSALQIEETNDLLAYRAKSVDVPCAIHVMDLSMVDNLLELETDYLMVSKVDGVKAQLGKLKEMGVLE